MIHAWAWDATFGGLDRPPTDQQRTQSGEGRRASWLQDPKAPRLLSSPASRSSIVRGLCFIAAGTETPEGSTSRKGGAWRAQALGCAWNGGAATSAVRSFPRYHPEGRSYATTEGRLTNDLAYWRPSSLGSQRPETRAKRGRRKSKEATLGKCLQRPVPRSRDPRNHRTPKRWRQKQAGGDSIARTWNDFSSRNCFSPFLAWN